MINNLDLFYANISSSIKLVASFTEKKYMDQIIRMCRLKPYSIIHGKLKNQKHYIKIQLHKHWIDEFGNSLIIGKGKRIRVVMDDPQLKNKKALFSDLYGCLPLDKLCKMAKLIYILVEHNNTTVVFVGIDNYLRGAELINGEWKQIAPLSLGMKTLIKIAKNIDIKYYKQLQNTNAKEWIGYWPPHRDFLESIKNYDKVFEVLHLKEKNKNI